MSNFGLSILRFDCTKAKWLFLTPRALFIQCTNCWFPFDISCIIYSSSSILFACLHVMISNDRHFVYSVFLCTCDFLSELYTTMISHLAILYQIISYYIPSWNSMWYHFVLNYILLSSIILYHIILYSIFKFMWYHFVLYYVLSCYGISFYITFCRITIINQSMLLFIQISHLNSTRITAILPRRNEVWIGLGNGRFLIFEIKKGPKPPPDSSDSSSTANITEEILPDVNDEEKESPASQPMDIISSAPTCCHETLIKKNSNNVSSFSLGDSGFVFVSRLSGSVNQLEPDDRFHIVLKQLQRISEDAVRCLLCVRYV